MPASEPDSGMKPMLATAWLAAGLAAAVACVATPATAANVSRYSGLCDASAAVALGPDHFVVADDERNTLVTYRRGQPAPVASLPLADFLGTAPDQESDLEGAAAIGARIFWISSHGRNKNGKPRPERQRFFATDVDTSTVPPSLKPVAAPYAGLLDDLLAADALKPYGLRAAAQRAPESVGGLNIEGLAATADGRLLIGFRSPIPGGRALLVPLDNPQAVVNAEFGGRAAKFGTPVLLSLGGRGIRSIERLASTYFIVAGAPDDHDDFALYRWSGQAHDAPELLQAVDLQGLRPEALFEVPMSNLLQVLSDDGGVLTQGVACKERDAARRAFRSISVVKP